MRVSRLLLTGAAIGREPGAGHVGARRSALGYALHQSRTVGREIPLARAGPATRAQPCPPGEQCQAGDQHITGVRHLQRGSCSAPR